MQGKAYRITIYIGEDDHYRGKPLYLALLEMLRREGASGATATRGLAGFGAHSRMRTTSFADISAALPVSVEWVDNYEEIERILPVVRTMVDDGMIIREEIEVIQYAPGRQTQPLEQPVRAIMRSGVTTVRPTTPVADLVALLMQRGYRSLPVVDDNRRLVGMITDGDLIRRAGLLTRLGLQDKLTPEQMQTQLAALQDGPHTAAAIMTADVVSVRPDDKVRTAAALMAQHSLKRLPVIDNDHRLVGLISRVDVLRAVEYHQQSDDRDPAQGDAAPTSPRTGASVGELMNKDVPTVHADARLEEIVRALESSYQRRVIVVDPQRRVLGIITDGDLIRRSRYAHDPGLIRRLRNLITRHQEPMVTLPYAGETAGQLMTLPVITIQLTTPLSEVLSLMLRYQIKRLPVVDDEGRLQGLLGRNSLLNGLLSR
jgi:CBS domain-containing protein